MSDRISYLTNKFIDQDGKSLLAVNNNTYHLPGLPEARVIQVKIRPNKGSDDWAYGENGDLQFEFYRSFSEISFLDRHFLNQGQPKFSSDSPLDEDGSLNNLGNNINLVRPERMARATHALETYKGNGKFFFLSGINYNSTHVLVVGSKGVHVPILWSQRKAHQLEGNQRTALVGKMLDCFNRLFDALTEDQQSRLQARLFPEDPEKRVNFLAEYEDNKHIVISPEHFLFFGMSRNILITSEDSLGENPIQSFQELESYGLPVVDHKLLTLEEYRSKNTDWNLEEGIEGRVIYFLRQQQDQSFFVEAMVKTKTHWYILWRVVRQILINNRKPFEFPTKLRSTLKDRNSFLKLSHEDFESWYQKLHDFGIWYLHHSKYQPQDINPGSQTNVGFGNVLHEYQSTDTSNLTIPGFDPLYKFDNTLFILKGIIGGGKTTLVEGLNHIERDSFGNSREFTHALVEQLRDRKTDYLVFSSNNSNRQHYRAVLQLAHEYRWKTVLVNCEELSKESSPRFQIMVYTSLISALKRKVHPTLANKTREEIFRIFTKFRYEYQHETRESQADFQTCFSFLKPEIDSLESKVPRIPFTETGDEVSQFLLEASQSAFPNQVRLSVPELRKNFLELISHYRSQRVKIPLPFDYYKCSINQEEFHRIQSMLPDINSKTTRVFEKDPHVTLITTKSENWSLEQPDYHGKSVIIIPTGYVFKETPGNKKKGPSHTVVIQAKLEDTDGNDLGHLIDSGHPHISYALRKGRAPMESVKELVSATSEQTFRFPEPHLRIESQIVLNGIN